MTRPRRAATHPKTEAIALTVWFVVAACALGVFVAVIS